MSNIFDKFDAQINQDELEKQKKAAAENAQEFEPVPAGKYITNIENMELGLTKDQRPMFKVQMRLVEGVGKEEAKFLAKYKKKKPCIFMNRVIFGTKNDGSMIASVEGWLAKIFPDDPIVFVSYTQFANEILDAAEDCEGLEFEVEYDDSKFNSISITDVFDAQLPV